MKIKKFLKDKLGKQYRNFYLKNILRIIFGKLFLNTRNLIKNNIKKLNFIKKNLNKKVEHQKIIQNETGFLLDLTKDNYLTYHLRPKLAKNFNLESTCKIKDKIAIVIQGPIQKKFEFLKNTINIYKKIFKNSLIIISTWENENINLINSLKDENIFIIFNKEPEKSQSNIDHQIYSTYIGLDLASKKGAKYSIKTRSDVRINKNNLETYLLSLINTFPVKENNFIKSRIIVPSLITFKYRLYSLSDITMFGETDDLIKYFENQKFEEGLKKLNINLNDLIINETPVIAEIFLCSRFINNIEGEVLWELNDWWRCLRNYFCVIDNSSIDLLWHKYDWEYEYRYLRTYSDQFARAIDFQDWLSLYNGYDNNWNLASNEHEKYNKYFQLQNIFKD